jgi:hypothetical protein
MQCHVPDTNIHEVDWILVAYLHITGGGEQLYIVALRFFKGPALSHAAVGLVRVVVYQESRFLR